ncbi:hypothetical protein PSCICJ_40260 [Pseudomonas cichorii]|uniref:hypothetical protein n=1 Tax=Pseudomonas cichorii TaxID=36746 RepID=UPI0019105035|nr:hypothetical protein [Pseudomonas cichorii]GFM67908.1 hypothetical protein PSCICJ_40260 [Pseudomonas cichorii]
MLDANATHISLTLEGVSTDLQVLSFIGREHRITHLDRKTEARADDHLTVGATQHVKVGTAQFVEAGTEIHYYAGDKVNEDLRKLGLDPDQVDLQALMEKAAGRLA